MIMPVEVMPDLSTVAAIDAALAREARAHELVFVVPYGRHESPDKLQSESKLRGPISIVTTHIRSTPDGAIVAGLARSVGDFVIEWRGPLNSIDGDLIGELLAPSDIGVELVEVTGVEPSRASRLFNRAVNSLRPRGAPVRRTIGRVYSRYAVQAVLTSVAFESQVDVLVAELPVQRIILPVPLANPPHAPLLQRLSNGFALLSKGTRFGSAVPLALAAIWAFAGLGAAIYAVGFLLRGRTPEGWTTLMVMVGLGQAVTLTMLGLTWTRIDSLAKGLTKNPDMTAAVQVIAPTQGRPFG